MGSSSFVLALNSRRFLRCNKQLKFSLIVIEEGVGTSLNLFMIAKANHLVKSKLSLNPVAQLCSDSNNYAKTSRRFFYCTVEECNS